jgi:RNA polymerase sigma factor (sigma-70 family)
MLIEDPGEAGGKRTIKELEHAWKAGDTSAFGALAEIFKPRLISILRRLLSLEDAEDTFQDICIYMLTRRDRFDPVNYSIEQLFVYLAMKRPIDQIKKRQKRREAILLDIHTDPKPLSDTTLAQQELVGRIISRSERGDQQIVLLRVEGLTLEEIATSLSIPVSSVKTAWARIVKAARLRDSRRQ